ncbi:MAG: hypothetical protein K9M44_03005 [Candidatus Pacebacteria bacterium]|nr:hypothetical protein [Candidatus Paceibacterota bacterium]
MKSKKNQKISLFKLLSALLFKKVRENDFNKWRGEDGYAVCPGCGTSHFAANAITYADHFLGRYIECRVCDSRNLVGNDSIPIKKQNTGEKSWEPWVSADKKFYQCPNCRSYNIHEESFGLAVGFYVSTELSCTDCGCKSETAQIPWIF